MARKGTTAAAAVCVLLVLLCVGWSHGVAIEPKSKDEATHHEDHHDSQEPTEEEAASERKPRVPTFILKRQQYAKRRAAFELIMQSRMTALAQTTATFATQLYRHHVSGAFNSSSSNVIGSGRRKYPQDVRSDNVLLSPLSAYVSLAMTMTSSKGRTKREVIAALAMEGEGRGVHAALERALTSLRDDDTAYEYENDDVNKNIDMDDMDEEGVGRGDNRLENLSDEELEEMIRNDYALDNKISYGTGQSQIRYGAGVSAANNNPPPKPKPKYMQIRLANGMFHSEDVGLSQQYSNRLVSLYGAPPMALQQQEPEVPVNLWVDAVTGGAVPDMLGAGDVATDDNAWIVLASAFSFRGEWKDNFDEKEVPFDFRTSSGETVVAPYMYRAGNYSVKTLDEVGKAKVLEIPYANTRYSLYIFRPRSVKRFKDLEDAFKTRPLRDLIGEGGNAMPEPSMTILMLPKFHLSARTRLDSELKAMGVRRLFANGKADLRRMTGENKKELFVDRFFQHANLEVGVGDVKSFKGNRIEIGGSDDLGHGALLQGEPGDEVANSSLSESPGEYAPTEDVHENGDADSFSEKVDEGGDVHTEGGDVYDEGNYEYDDEDYEDWGDDYEEEEEEDAELGDSNTYFFADKPFLFVVLDKQYDLILLMGRIMSPLPWPAAVKMP